MGYIIEELNQDDRKVLIPLRIRSISTFDSGLIIQNF